MRGFRGEVAAPGEREEVVNLLIEDVELDVQEVPATQHGPRQTNCYFRGVK